MVFRLTKIYLLIIVLTIFELHVSYGQQTVSLDLRAAVDSALNNNIKIQQYKQVVLQKQYLTKAAAGNFFPSIDLLGGYTYFSKILRSIWVRLKTLLMICLVNMEL